MLDKEKDYFSTREAAKLLNVAVSTVQLWTDNGLLQAWTTVGGHRRIYKESVNNILMQKKEMTSNSADKIFSIVVVEDNKQERMLYKKKFEMWEFNVNVVILNDGYSGLLNIGKIVPDIIITDLMMPNMNGFEMIKAIKENPDLKHSLIIVVSALTNDEIRIRGGLSSDIIVFSKPLQFNNIEKLINKKIMTNVA